MAYEPPAIETDEDVVSERILDNMSDAMPGWEPVEGAPEVALAEEIGRETVDLNVLAGNVLDYAAAGVGQTVYQLAPRDPAHAVLPDVEINFNPVAPGPAGLAASTVPAGFTIVVNGVAFQLLEDVTPTSTDPLHVAMEAIEPGTQGNIDVDEPIDAEVITSTLAVSSATVLDSGAGGVDEEPLADYLSRLVDYVSLLRPGGVRGEDLAALARTVEGVHRALGIDLYDPSDGSDDNERTATVIAIDANGQPLGGFHLALLGGTLQAAREVNFVIHLAAPTYTQVEIVAVVYAEPDANTGDVAGAVTIAIEALIDPASWGSSANEPHGWTERAQLRVFDVAAAVLRVDGVASIDTITINGGAGTVILDGPGALPTSVDDPDEPSTVSVTVEPLP